jgi:hypothetical protein
METLLFILALLLILHLRKYYFVHEKIPVGGIRGDRHAHSGHSL